MGPHDGVDLLLESIDHLVKKRGRDDTLFVLIGFGSELRRLRTNATARGLDPWVKFMGPLYGEDLRAYLATADVAVAPDPSNTLNDKLTMVKIFEYMACGLPVVLYDLVDGRRSAEDAALYASGNDPINFADQIARLLESESLCQRLGAIGRIRARENLTWEVEKQKLLAVYEFGLQGAALPVSGRKDCLSVLRPVPASIMELESLPAEVDSNKHFQCRLCPPQSQHRNMSGQPVRSCLCSWLGLPRKY